MQRFDTILSDRITKKLESLFNNLIKYSIDIEDIKQEAFKIILENRKKYRKSFGAYDDFILGIVKAELIKYIKTNTENLTDEDIGATSILPDVDYRLCQKYLKFFNSMTLLEKYIIVSYFYSGKPIYKIANELSTATRRVSGIIDTYTTYIKKEMK